MKVIIIIFCLSLIGCKQPKPEGFFKYYGEYHIGDFIELPSRFYEIKNDTIFKREVPMAKYLGTRRRLDGNLFLEIESFDSGEKGMYIKK